MMEKERLHQMVAKTKQEKSQTEIDPKICNFTSTVKTKLMKLHKLGIWETANCENPKNKENTKNTAPKPHKN